MTNSAAMPAPAIAPMYDYRLRGWSLLFSAFILCLMGSLMLFMSRIEPDAFIGIALAPNAGTLLYGVSGLALFILLAMILIRVRSQTSGNRAIRFGANSVTLPKSLYSNARVEIPYTSICGLKQERMSRAATSFITIEYDDTCLRIADMGFETMQDFEAVYSQLEAKRIPFSQDCS